MSRVVSETRSASVREIELTADVHWADGWEGSMEASFNALSPDDQVEAGLRVGLLGASLLSQISSGFESMVDTSDPLDE